MGSFILKIQVFKDKVYPNCAHGCGAKLTMEHKFSKIIEFFGIRQKDIDDAEKSNFSFLPIIWKQSNTDPTEAKKVM